MSPLRPLPTYGLSIATFLVMLFPMPCLGAEVMQPDLFWTARVENIREERTEQILDVEVRYQSIELTLLSGLKKGERITVSDESRFGTATEDGLREGDSVTVRASCDTHDQCEYSIDDRYRLPSLAFIGALFVMLVVFFGRVRGLTSLVGLLISIAILAGFIVPALGRGAHPLLVILLGGACIAIISMYTAHGINRRTSIALTSTLLALAIGAVLAEIAVRITQLGGLGSESAFYLTAQVGNEFSFQGLLLGGIIVGMLGVLDDVTTAQVATVSEIHEANPTLSRRELYRRGLRVGREHISSLVNTLALAYAGTALPLMLLLSITEHAPWWVLINSEFFAEEIVRTLLGSAALILAIPLSTALATRMLTPVASKER